MQLRTDPLTGLRVLTAGGPPESEAVPDLFGAAADTAVVEALEHPPLAELDAAQTIEALQQWRTRIAAHADAACVHLAADSGAAGATLTALPFVPAAVARERERFAAHAARTMGGNLLGDLVQEEVRRRQRLVHYDDEAVVLTAFAPRSPYQLLVVPRRPVARFEVDGPLGAAALHEGLARLRRARPQDPARVVWVRTAPRGADTTFCWRIDVLPAPVPDALDLGTGVASTAVAPEQAAADLRAVTA